jgi:lambda family phage portal protein
MVTTLRETRPKEAHWSRRTSERIDDFVGILSPRRALLRKAYRFSYDAIDSHRLRKKRTGFGGTGDTHLTEQNLYKLREINRELTRNNPLIEGLFETERDGVIGSGPVIQARTGDDKLNEELEAAWKEYMLDRPCDVTRRFNFNSYLGVKYLTYRRDGDCASIFVDGHLQAVEGEQIGSPFGEPKPLHYEVVNGCAYSKKTKALIGFYIGESDRKWGYIKAGTWKKYTPERVHHMFNPRRFTQSRGVPALTSSIDFIDKMCGYIDAELVAAKVAACFSAFVKTNDAEPLPAAYTKGVSTSGEDSDNVRLEKLEPGTIMYGQEGEDITTVGMNRPTSAFDQFLQRVLTLIGRPMCLPLMLITLDFSGATFMNARIAYQKVQDAWMREQEWVVKPFVSRIWRWKMQQLIDRKIIKVTNEKLLTSLLRHEVFCKRWPYVDPFKEAKADEAQLKNGTTTRRAICSRQGDDYGVVSTELFAEEKQRKEQGLPAPGEKPKGAPNAVPK